MLDISPTIPIIILKVSGTTATIKRQRLSEQIKKYDPTIGCLQENYFKYREVLGENGFSSNYKFQALVSCKDALISLDVTVQQNELKVWISKLDTPTFKS